MTSRTIAMTSPYDSEFKLLAEFAWNITNFKWVPQPLSQPLSQPLWSSSTTSTSMALPKYSLQWWCYLAILVKLPTSCLPHRISGAVQFLWLSSHSSSCTGSWDCCHQIPSSNASYSSIQLEARLLLDYLEKTYNTWVSGVSANYMRLHSRPNTRYWAIPIWLSATAYCLSWSHSPVVSIFLFGISTRLSSDC